VIRQADVVAFALFLRRGNCVISVLYVVEGFLSSGGDRFHIVGIACLSPAALFLERHRIPRVIRGGRDVSTACAVSLQGRADFLAAVNGPRLPETWPPS